MGRWLRHSYYPNWNLRLFQHRFGRFERLTSADTESGDVEVHEHVVIDGETGRMRTELDHYAFPTITNFVEKHNRYSNWEAHVTLEAAMGNGHRPQSGACAAQGVDASAAVPAAAALPLSLCLAARVPRRPRGLLLRAAARAVRVSERDQDVRAPKAAQRSGRDAHPHHRHQLLARGDRHRRLQHRVAPSISASAGHDVTMCAAVPYYPQWRVPAEYRGLKFTREARAGVTILRCPLYVPAAVNPIRRVLHEASFIASAFLRSLFCRRPDILFVVSPPLGLAIAAVDSRLAVAGAVRVPRRRPAARYRARSRDGAAGPFRAAALRGRAAGVSARRDRLHVDRGDARSNHREGDTGGEGDALRRLGRSAAVRARRRPVRPRSARSWAWATPSSCSTPATWA